jgi:hypothetical protein
MTFLKTILVNIGLFAVFYLMFFFVAFSLGLASSDKQVPKQWALYFIFCIIQVATFSLICKYKFKDRRPLFFNYLLILLLWGMFGILYGL